jgi:hypothetical protein
MQLFRSVFAVNEKVFAGHGMQLDSAVAAGVERYLPAPQLMHSEDPASELYVPAGQALQPSPGRVEHAVFSGITYRRSSFETVCISLSVRCMSQISSCDRSQSLVCAPFPFPKQLMHRFLVRPASMALILSCCVVPAHSPALPSDLVLVPLAIPLMSTFSGTTPPFLLHMTTQSAVGSMFASAVLATAV